MKTTTMKNLTIATSLAAFLALAGCSKAPEATAQAQDTVKKAAATVMNYDAIGIPSGTYELEKTHGHVFFSYSHFGLSNPHLRFREIDASINLDADNLEKSSVSATIQSASIDSGVDIFDEHLNSDGWFDTAKHPEITFKSTGFKRATQTTGTMTGDMTIMGITKPVTFDVTLLAAMEHPRSKKPVMGLEGSGKVLRSDFGLGKYAPSVSDEVEIGITGEFILAE